MDIDRSVPLSPLAPKGLFLRDGVIGPDFMKEIVEAVVSSRSQLALVSSAGSLVLNQSYRNSHTVAVESETVRRIREIFESLRADLESFFDEPLGACQAPVFLRYGVGQYFRMHCDNAGDPRQPRHIRARRVSTVLFLNSANADGLASVWAREPRFEGGELILYRLGQRVTWTDFYTIAVGRAGRVVAFGADADHEVSTVTSGIRLSVVSWFEAAQTTV